MVCVSENRDMASISSSSGVQAATQQGWQQMQLQQARRTAEQAEQQARALKAQADGAQRAADQAQENARSLSVRSDQAQASAGQARQGVTAIQTREQMQVRLGQTVEQVAIRLQEDQAPAVRTSVPATDESASPPPVINVQGQVTGTVINTTA